MHFLRRHVRGRPPHPDVLTPAEWRVLEHIRQRRTNAEIAVRLGVSVNTVRTHVSSMLAKLQVADRAELARWRGEPALATRAVLRGRGVPAATGPLAWLRNASARAAPTAKGLATGGTIIGVGAGIIGIAALATRVETDAGLPGARGQIERPALLEATLGAPVTIDGDYLIVNLPSAGATQPIHVERARVESGVIHSQKVVLDPAEFGNNEHASLSTWRSILDPPSSAGEALFATVCVDPLCGDTGSPTPNARTVLLRSIDHGATWSEVDTLEGAFTVLTWSPGGNEALLRRMSVAGADTPQAGYVRWPSMTDILLPALRHGTLLRGSPGNPLLLGDGGIAWWTTAGLVDGAGDLVLDFASLDLPVAEETLHVSLSPDRQRLLLTWNSAAAAQDGWRWTLFQRSGKGPFEAVQTLVQPEAVAPAAPYSWLDGDRVIISALAGVVPAVVDFGTARVSPIAGFGDDSVFGRGDYVINVVAD
jgi:DNA-binding CsgD family transcriptional regulator